MKNVKHFGKRRMALILVLMLFMGLLGTSVFAADDTTVGTQTGVQAFLNAVDAIEAPEEDLALTENTELPDGYRAEVHAAYELWTALGEEDQARHDVEIAMSELENMMGILPEYSISLMARTTSSGVTVNPEYNPGLCYPGVTKYAGTISKNVGDTGYYLRRAVKNFWCPACGYFFGQSVAKEYANIQWEQSVPGVIDDVSFKAATPDGYGCMAENYV